MGADIATIRSQGWNPDKGNRFFFSPKRPDRRGRGGGEPDSCSTRMGVKRPGHEVVHSPTSSVEVKNELCYTPLLTLYAFMECTDTNV
jgi:hypothetical protein